MYGRKLTCLAFFVLALGLPCGALAATWTGSGADDSWCTPENWDSNTVPGSAETAAMNPPPERGPVIDCDVEVGSIEGPKWSSDDDQVMDITGGTLVINGQWRFANGGSGTATVNIAGSPDITINGAWRSSDSPSDLAAFNVSGGSIACGSFKIGDDGRGQLNISGGSIDVAGNMDLGGVRGSADITISMTGGAINVEGTLGAPPYAGGPGIVTINLGGGAIRCASFYNAEAYAMDIAEGVLIVEGNDVTSDFLADVNAGYITAYDGQGTVNVEFFSGDTVVTASVPDANLASRPHPFSGATDVSPDVELSWTPGAFADLHDVYLGTDFNDVNNAADPNVLPARGRQDSNSFIPPEFLEFGAIYYWRIDEVNGLNIWKGKVWSFTTADGKADDPYPADGGSSVPRDANLTWTPGILAFSHDVYFGTDFNSVRDADTGTYLGVYKGRQGANSYDPCGLELNTLYYWRIDEVGDATFVKGDVWSFRTSVANIVGHSIVYGGPDIFCGWPANNGVWIWGNEILVGFVYGPYVEVPGHNLGSPSYTGLGRSLDGGLNWTFEDPDNFVGDGGTPVPSPGGINFAHPDFAWRTESYTSQGQFFISYDRGHNWQGPYTCGDLMNHPELSGLQNSSRTDYVINGPDDCLIGMSVSGCGPTDRAFMARTTDAGATFDFVSWINPELCTTRGVMPSTVRISESKLVTTLRRKYPGEWIDAFVSYDNGNSWSFLSKVTDTYAWNGNPPALVRLPDGRLCCAYGNRLDRRIEARVSEDEGATWSDEIILRDDYQTDSFDDPDLGYCRMVQRPDGKLVTMYYWATPEHPTHHIAATIWDAGGTGGLECASNPSPYSGAKDVPPNAVLSWEPGDFAASHDVYFGTGWDDVNDADTSSSEYKGRQSADASAYDPCGLLALDTTYYWRIDEVNDPNVRRGDVWLFTTRSYIVVDDMESYNDTDNKIYDTWIDGPYNGTGSWLLLGIDPCEAVHGGLQSMVFSYDNDDSWGSQKYSEIERTYADPCDWTALGVKVLALWFYGDPDNDANVTEQMYVGLKDSRGRYAEVRYGDAGEDVNDIKVSGWQQWLMALQDFNDGGVDLAEVNTVHIGFGDRDNPVPGGSGVVYFDDIRLRLPLCVQPGPAADLTGDCVVDFADLRIMAGDWLLNDQLVPVTAPNAPILYYQFEQTSGTTVTDSSGNGYTGTFFTDVNRTPAEIGGRIDPGKDGSSFHFSARIETGGISMPNDVFADHGISREITVASWIKNSHPDELPDGGAFMWEFRQWDGISTTGGARVLAVETTDRNANFVFRDDSGTAAVGINWASHTDWKHYAFVRDSDSLLIYVNGFEGARGDSSGNAMAAPGLLYVGVSADRAPGNTNGLHDGFTGNMDDWRIYDYALSPEEIVYLATDGTGYYRLESVANLYDQEPPGSKAINLRDYSELANSWLEEKLWPSE